MINEQDFTKLYNAHAPKVQRLCLGYAAGNTELAKEWLQETFIKVWKHRNSFKGKSSIDTWIYRIAVNVCIGNLRTSRKTSRINEELMSVKSMEEESNDHSAQVEKNIEKMYHCIDQLNAQNRTLILLELEDIPQATIAETVGLAHGTLRTRLSRIRQSLLKCIKNGK